MCVFRVPTRAPVRMPGNRGVGREQKGGATSGSTARVLEDRGAHEGKEETEVDGRENASGCHVEVAPLANGAVGGIIDVAAAHDEQRKRQHLGLGAAARLRAPPCR